MKWRKLGSVFCAAGQYEWMQSHTACPIPLSIGEGYYRIYYGARDAMQRPRVGYVVLHMDNPCQVLEISKEPVLEPGPWGNFDDNGVYPGCILLDEKRILMLYLGRSNGEPPLFYMSIGLAESLDNGLTFKKTTPAPFFGRDRNDPWMVSTNWILREDDRWKMWYMSGIGWRSLEEKISCYDIKYAESCDMIHWDRRSESVIPIENEETNIASPCIWREDGKYTALYSVARSHATYRLESAISDDGIHWVKTGVPEGLEYSPSGWDSQCMAYPSSFVFQNRRYCLYSGNENGKAGFGIAVLEK